MKQIRYIIICFFTFFYFPALAQVKFSLATDLSVLHNFDKVQKFTAVGQTIIPQWHLDKKNTIYIWFNYHTAGKYKAGLTADARSSSTQPQMINFNSSSSMRLRQFSVGLKRFLKGYYDDLSGFNIYGTAGFGLIIGTASNNFSRTIDTTLYHVKNNVINGSGDFKRLSFDIAGGIEFPISYEIFIYSEIRVNIPTSSYPSGYLIKNSNNPFTGAFNFGIRVSFNADP